MRKNLELREEYQRSFGLNSFMPVILDKMSG